MVMNEIFQPLSPNKKYWTRKKLLAAGASVLALAGCAAPGKGAAPNNNAAPTTPASVSVEASPSSSIAAPSASTEASASTSSTHAPAAESASANPMEQMNRKAGLFQTQLAQVIEGIYETPGRHAEHAETIDDGSELHMVDLPTTDPSGQSYHLQVQLRDPKAGPETGNVENVTVQVSGPGGAEAGPVYNLSLSQRDGGTFMMDVSGNDWEDYGLYDGSMPDYAGTTPIDTPDKQQAVIAQAQDVLAHAQHAEGIQVPQSPVH
jgi:hypothetical protein